ncbi:unnamed protein product [Haemonchus placei]|uniref:ABC transmembrane type-1 domain-containing protein n=1 Tax=Haemonchus placei TaxID=6290 RepID=A0A0N4VWF8_HAEPC|nr:unnamed protein product [Haemonchus placei]
MLSVIMSLKSLLSTPLLRAAKINESIYDGVILVTSCAKIVAELPPLKELSAAVLDFIEVRSNLQFFSTVGGYVFFYTSMASFLLLMPLL